MPLQVHKHPLFGEIVSRNYVKPVQDCLQDSSIGNTMPPWQVSFKASIHPNQRYRSHSFYCPRHRRHFSRSQSHPHSHHNRSSRFRRHILLSSSSHQSSLCNQLAGKCSCYPSCHDINRHSDNPSHTCHFSCRCHSCHSMN